MTSYHYYQSGHPSVEQECSFGHEAVERGLLRLEAVDSKYQNNVVAIPCNTLFGFVLLPSLILIPEMTTRWLNNKMEKDLVICLHIYTRRYR